MPFNLKSIFAGGVTEAVKTVNEAVDKWIDTKAEKAERELELQKILIEQQNKQAELAQQELDAYLKDVQNSREMNARVQESEKASWLSKNVGYIIDGIIISAFVIMLYIIAFKIIPIENKDLFNIGFGALGTYVATVVAWHRGSSSGSKANAETVRKIVENNK